jgi:hypothetical protein
VEGGGKEFLNGGGNGRKRKDRIGNGDKEGRKGMEVAKGRELTDKKMGKNQQGRLDGANSTVLK